MKRLDQALAEKYSITRSLSTKYIKKGLVTLFGETASSPNKAVSDIDLDGLLLQDPTLVNDTDAIIATPENIPLEILYEDENVLVVNKMVGMSVHPSRYESHGTLANALVFHFEEIIKNFPELQFRPGIVHRLDKHTSGVLIVAKNQRTHAFLSAQFKERVVVKEYRAIISGIIQEASDITQPITRNKKEGKKMMVGKGGRDAWTRIEPINHYFKDLQHKYTYIRALPKTGRTHQIRVHVKSLGYPIVGDLIYHGEVNDHMFLHAYSLKISIPVFGERVFQVDPPDYFDQFLSSLNAYEIDYEQKKLSK